jgi:hypothetical protein
VPGSVASGTHCNLNSHVIYEVCIKVLFVVAVREMFRTEIQDKEYLGAQVKCPCNENWGDCRECALCPWCEFS